MVNSVIQKVDAIVFSIWGVLRLAHNHAVSQGCSMAVLVYNECDLVGWCAAIPI